MLKPYRILFAVITALAAMSCPIVLNSCTSIVQHQKQSRVPQTINIKKGPYLIYDGTTTQMRVLWQVDRNAACSLSWGADTVYSAGNAVTFEYNADHQHTFTMAGLIPNKKYYYRIAAGEHTFIGSFLTASAADANALEFLAYGDTRTNPDRQNQVCKNIITTYTADPNCQTFILHVGDWVEKNSEVSWASEFFDRTYTGTTAMQANLPIQGCMGNHEGDGTVYTKYWPYPYVAGRYWSFDYGPAHIAIVDQYTDYSPDSAQLQWLANDLSSSEKLWKFVVLHEPGWSAGSFHGNNKNVQANIQPLCEKYGVQIVFAGHNHYYARAVVNGVQHLTVGGGGAPGHTPNLEQPNIVATNQGLGYCKISISGNALKYQMYRSPQNMVIDTFTITQP